MSESNDGTALNLEKQEIEEPPVVLEVHITPRELSYAFLRGKVIPEIAISVTNNTETPIKHAKLVVSTSTQLLHQIDREIPLDSPIREASSGSNISRNSFKCLLNSDLFRDLSEDDSQSITVALVGEDGTEITSHVESIDIKPFDYWVHKYSILPVFVRRNDEAVKKLASHIGEVLVEYCGSSALSGYQNKEREHVRKQCAAIYAVLQKQGVHYSEPLVDDELHGQRIRSAEEILNNKLGTCLDLAVLFCSVAECIGLHPIICVTPTHAFPGVYLDEENTCGQIVLEDPSRISQDGGRRICVLESTCLTQDLPVSFESACGKALQIARQEEDLSIVDIKYARLCGIRPLPERKTNAEGAVAYIEDEDFEVEQNRPWLRDEYDDIDLSDEKTVDNTPKGRIERWQRKLLNFSFRNPLMNMRTGSSVVQILCPDVNSFENVLTDGSTLLLHPDVDGLLSGEVFSESEVEMLKENPALIQHLNNKQLLVAESSPVFKKKLGTIYRKTQKNLSESGVYTLYLTLGHIEYYIENQMYRAPVLLYPVALSRTNGEFALHFRDDEEPQLNFSIFEKFRTDYHYETHLQYDNLPTDESGLDIQTIFNILRAELSKIARWKLVESCSLGIYSFDQFVMYNDLKGHPEAIQKNKVVRSLVQRKLAFEQPPLPEVTDEDFLNQVVPTSCDESQLKAVKAAAEGFSFILQGPPGTGKSQTITSIIVNAMVHGKKVLFVAEKMAALQVVYRNLSKAGVSSHLMELHSIKATKAHFLEQLNAALNQRGDAVDRDEANERKITRINEELTHYILVLHQKRSCGMSLYQLINSYQQYRGIPERQIPYASIEGVQRKELDIISEKLQEIAFKLKRFYPLQSSPYKGLLLRTYDEDKRQHVGLLATKLVENIKQVEVLKDAIVKGMPACAKTTFSVVTGGVLKEMVDSLEVLKRTEIDKQILEMGQYQLQDGLAILKRFYSLKNLNTGLTGWNPEILRMSIPSLIQEWDSCKSGLLKGKKRKQFLSKINSMAPDGLAITAENVIDELKKLNHFVAMSEQMKKEEEKIPSGMRFLASWKQEEAEGVVSSIQIYRNCVAKVLSQMECWESEERCLEIATCWFTNDQYVHKLEEFNDCQSDIQTRWDELQPLVSAENTLKNLSYEELKERLNIWSTRSTDMALWAQCNDLVSSLKNIPFLGPFLDLLLDGMEVKDVVDCLLVSFYRSSIDGIFQQESSLFQYNQSEFDKIIRMMIQAEDSYRDYVRSSLPSRMDALIPDERAGHELKRYVASKGKRQSVRQFLSCNLNSVLTYFPCFLMSPMSVAQYLDPEQHPFDLVVFDEASQIPTCQAIGSISRGENLIVVGDAKQMPPTSFFQKSSEDDEEEEFSTGDLDSILADCNDIDLPQTCLNWHYRSTNESLIEFSNKHYYHHLLKTYPSVDYLHSMVSLRKVDGYYESKSKEPNQAEADAIVKEIIRRLKDPRTCKDSIGVITFGEKQQSLIQDRLDDVFSRKHNLAKLAKWDQSEIDCQDRLIVKNLENMQGDERDVILLSVTYGKSKSGRFSTNFGPISAMGGENRLNVAFSRAKKEMIVFTIIDLAEFATKQISSKGGNDLREFLNYAASNCEEPNKRQGPKEQNFVAREILERLKESGYEGELDVGHSAFHVDIALKNPKKPDIFFCGILLDGTNMLHSKLTNDRFFLPESLLNGRKWKVIHVRIIDWFNNSEEVAAYLLDQVNTFRDQLDDSVEENQDKVTATEEQTDDTRVCREYRGYEFEETDSLLAEDFTKVNPQQLIIRYQKVIEGEGPITEDLLEIRVLKSFGLKRRGQNIKPQMDNVVRTAGFVTTTQTNLKGETQYIYWPEEWRGVGDVESTYKQYRKNSDETTSSMKEYGNRKIIDIPQIEILNAMYHVLQREGSLIKESLISKTVNALGFKSQGKQIQEVFDLVFKHACETGKLEITDELEHIGIATSHGDMTNNLVGEDIDNL